MKLPLLKPYGLTSKMTSHQNNGYILISALLFLSLATIGLGSLAVLLQFQVKATYFRVQQLQVEAMAQTGWKYADLVWASLPTVATTVSKTVLLSTVNRVYISPNGTQLCLAKSSNAVYSVGISQNGEFRATFKKTFQVQPDGNKAWGALEKW